METTTEKPSHYRFIALALITIVLALSTGDRATLSIAGTGMAKSLGIDPIGMGWLFSAFAWAYVLGQIPAGWIVDKLGAKLGILLGLVLWSSTTFVMSGVGWLSAPFLALLILRFMLGLFECPVGPASGRVIAAWFPSSERGAAGAIFNSAQYLSLAVFTPLMGWLDHRYGWEHIFGVMGLLGLILAAVWAAIFYVPSRHPKVTRAEVDYIRAGGGLVDLDSPNAAATASTAQAGPSMASFGALFRSRMLVGIFIAQYCITSITWFFVSWFPSYLVKGRGFSMLEAGFIAALPAICGCIGGVSTGFFSDWLLRRTGNLTLARKIPITIGLTGSAMMIACNFTDSGTLVIVFMCLAFFGKGFGSLGWTVVADTAPKEIIGLTGGVFNGIGNAAGIVTPLVIGYILASTGSFNGALTFVGLHGLAAIFCYWVIVGPIQRFQLPASLTTGGLSAHPAGAK